MYTLSHDPSSDTQPSSEVTIETKRHRAAEVDKAITSARCDADLADAPSRATYTASKSCSSASQPSESNCMTGTPGNCVTGYPSIDIFVVASFVRSDLRFAHEHDRCVREPIKRTFTRTCARVHVSSAPRRRRARKRAEIRREIGMTFRSQGITIRRSQSIARLLPKQFHYKST